MKIKRLKPPKGDQIYRQIWRVIDGAVLDCFKQHPEYIKGNLPRVVRESLVKRATGAVSGYLEQSKKGRSGSSPAAKQG